ncbi:UDP-N-acetylglucosamine transferase subunit ALG13 isoform X2 [Centruroides vittatus]
MKSIFVTVGTTSFDKLIRRICSLEVLQIIKSHNFTKLVLQVGNGSYEPELEENNDIEISWYRYKESLYKDMKEASLVISHAGAGCILEALRLQKPLLVVVNEDLMDNHQFELASQLADNNHLIYCTIKDLQTTLKTLDISHLIPLPPVETEMFPAFINKVMCYYE